MSIEQKVQWTRRTNPVDVLPKGFPWFPISIGNKTMWLHKLLIDLLDHEMDSMMITKSRV
jgi:hypothetical protein